MIDQRLNAIIDCLYRVAGKAVIINDGKLLLVREEQGWYGLPGGGVAHGEDIRASLAREISEELGTTASVDEIPEQPAFVSTEGIVKGIPRTTLFYLVDLEKINFAPKSVLRHTWVDKQDLAVTQLAPNIAVVRDKLESLVA